MFFCVMKDIHLLISQSLLLYERNQRGVFTTWIYVRRSFMNASVCDEFYMVSMVFISTVSTDRQIFCSLDINFTQNHINLFCLGSSLYYILKFIENAMINDSLLDIMLFKLYLKGLSSELAYQIFFRFIVQKGT